jgi:heme a synthase
VRRLALASVACNVGIVVTGGAVRLTGSGLGCPTWPRCTDDSYVPTSAMEHHSLIEFGNRMVTFVLGLVMVAAFAATVLQRPRRGPLVRLSLAALAGIPAQAVIGGVTVLTGLNPWTVAAHFLASMLLLAATVLLWQRAREDADTPPRAMVRPEMLLLARVLTAVTAVTLVMGTLVTGSGPHAGDRAALRTGFDPAVVSQLHADVVMLLVGLSVATWVALRATGAPAEVRRAAAALVGVELAQGLVGYVQYFTGLPVVVVGLHMLGACLVWIGALRVLLACRVRRAVPGPRPGAAAGGEPVAAAPPVAGAPNR